MTDYWKSNPRKFCEVCKCWFGDNEASVNFHEQGRRHITNVQRQLREARSNASVVEKDKKKTLEMLASIEHAAISAYNKDIVGTGGSAVAQKRKKISLPTDEDIHTMKVQEMVSTIAAEKNKEVEKITIQENISKKLGELKAESMAWQPLLSPQGYTYYYNTITGVSQWEVPAGVTPPPQVYPSYTPTPAQGTPTTSQPTTTQDQTNQYPNQENETNTQYTSQEENEANTQKRSASPTSNEEGPSSPKRSRRSGPYGRWETVAEYEYVEPVPENTVTEEPEEENKEEVVEFEEKTLPVKQETEPEPEREYGGGFKKFSFKKRGSGRAPIKLRTTQLS